LNSSFNLKKGLHHSTKEKLKP